MLARVAETKDSRKVGRETMMSEGKDTHGGYVPAEWVFMPAVAMPGIVAIDGAFIEKVLREMGDMDGALACYEHFIGVLRRFTMVSLGVAVADEIIVRKTKLS